MNEQERAELDRLKQRLESLRHELDVQGMQMRELEGRLALHQHTGPSASFEIKPMEITPLAMPPGQRIGNRPPPLPVQPPEVAGLAVEPLKVPLVPPVIPLRPAPAHSRENVEACTEPASALPDSPRADSPSALPQQFSEKAVRESSFELRLGTYWLVRIGIVMLLTGLVFFGKFAYQNFVLGLGATGKVGLMYLGGAGLLFAGGWLQRGKERLRNYGQVLFAGGLAAVYFTTYAAHHIQHLRVFQSALLDGLLLLGWAGFMAFLADRKKSELLSLFAIGLAYYTSVITNIGLFTLYSNLVLTIAAVYFLVRNRWATLSFLSLAATYFAFAYWRYFHDGNWLWTDHETVLADFWPGSLFLLAYWILFTATAFLSRHEKLAGVNRATFVTLNNAAFFLLVSLSLVRTYRDSFWIYAFGQGMALLALALAARRWLAGETILRLHYLTQGLLLVTVGLIARFSGLQLALLLATESVVLLLVGRLLKNRVLMIGSYTTAALAVLWCIDGMKQSDRAGLYHGAGIGLLTAFNAWWSHRHDEEPGKSLLRPRATFFSVLALLVWLVATCAYASRENTALVLATGALVLTASVYIVRLREIAVLGQGYVIFAQWLWLLDHLQGRTSPSWWNSALLVAITLALSHWWQRQTVIKLETHNRQLLLAIYALAAVGVIYFWLHPLFVAPVWLAVTGLVALALTAYGTLTRAWFVAATGQVFTAVSIGEFMRQLAQDHPNWIFALAPMAALAILSFSTVEWFRHHAGKETELRVSLLGVALLYRWLALAMAVAWVHEYIPARERCWVFALLGLLVFCWSGWRRSQEGFLFSAALTLAGLLAFWFPWGGAPTVYGPNLLAILLLPGQQQLARRAPGRFEFKSEFHAAIIVLSGLSLWLFVSRWVSQEASGSYLPVSWAALAFLLFLVGLGLRERMYRWVGLTVLGCALGRVVVFDVWKLQTIYRIVSFFALGVVLVVLGFIYNKYQEKIKEWL